MVPERIHTPPQKIIGKILREGVLKAKVFEEKYGKKLNWNFRGERVQNKKKKIHREYGFFSGTTHVLIALLKSGV